MALQLRRGTAAEVASNSFVPAIGEPLYVTDEGKLYIGDGATQKGISVGGASKLEDLNSVTLVTESVGSITSYSVSGNVATISIAVGKGYTTGLVVTIANSPVAALNGDHTITGIVTVLQFTIALTTADVSATATSGSVTPIVPDGHSLVWDAANSYWKNAPPSIEIINNLDLNGFDIISTGTENIELNPAVNQNVVILGNAINGSGRIVLNCESNSHGITLKGPPHNAAATYTLTLPSALPTLNGQSLTADTNGILSFATIAGGTRATANATTASIADGASDDITIIGAKSYMLMSIQTSAAAWVTLYTNSVARTQDAARASNTDPSPGSGVVAQVITAAAATQMITPGLLGFNDESTPTSNIYCKVENQSGASTAITVTLSFLTLES